MREELVRLQRCCLLNGSRVVPAVWQQMHHVGMGRNPFGYVSWAARLGIVYQTYSVLGGASRHYEAITRAPAVVAIAARHGKSPQEVALQWVAQQDLPVVVLSSSAAHLGSNRDTVSGVWRLSAEEMEALSALDQPTGKPSHWGLCDDVPAPTWSAAWASHDAIDEVGYNFVCKPECSSAGAQRAMSRAAIAESCRDC